MAEDRFESAFTGDEVEGAITKAILLNDITLPFSDNETNNVSTARHGFMPKLPGSSSVVFTGDGTYKSISLLGSVQGPSSSQDNTVVLFDGYSGSLIKDSELYLAGSNTGDQTITLTGDISGTGTGSIATIIGSSKVLNSMLSGSIEASKLIQNDISRVGNLVTGSISGNFGSIHIDDDITANNLTINDTIVSPSVETNLINSSTGSISNLTSDNIETELLTSTNIISSMINSSTGSFTNLSSNFIPYHFNDLTGLVDSPIYVSGSSIGLCTISPTAQFTQRSLSTDEVAVISGTNLVDATGWSTGSAEWTGSFAGGFTHVAGNVTPLSRDVTLDVSKFYKIYFFSSTMSTSFSGAPFTISLGGTSQTLLYSPFKAYSLVIKPTNSTGDLIFTFPSYLNTSISSFEVKEIIPFRPSYNIEDSTGISSLEIRNSLFSNNNTFLGKNSGMFNTTGNNNLAFGAESLRSNQTGIYNLAIGSFALYSSAINTYNSAIGYNSLRSMVIGDYNTSIGSNAVSNLIEGSYNTAIGGEALTNCRLGSYNITLGSYTLASLYAGYGNIAIGGNSLYSSASGSYNSSIGHDSFLTITSGSFNTGLGYRSGRLTGMGGNLTASDRSVFIGSNSKAYQNSSVNEIVIGSNAIGAGSNTVTIGDINITKTILRGTQETSNPSNTHIFQKTMYYITSPGSSSVQQEITLLENYFHSFRINVAGFVEGHNGCASYDIYGGVCKVGTSSYLTAPPTIISLGETVSYEGDVSLNLVSGSLFLEVQSNIERPTRWGISVETNGVYVL